MGDASEFGPGLTSDKLRDYQYGPGMGKFNAPTLLGEFDSFDAAVAAVSGGLAEERGGISEVYRAKVPGKQAMLFGLKMGATDCSGDEFIMSKIDKGPTMKRTAHLPYELAVIGTKVYGLDPTFRIAISFPDLTMADFTPIMCVMTKIPEALTGIVQ